MADNKKAPVDIEFEVFPGYSVDAPDRNQAVHKAMRHLIERKGLEKSIGFEDMATRFGMETLRPVADQMFPGVGGQKAATDITPQNRLEQGLESILTGSQPPEIVNEVQGPLPDTPLNWRDIVGEYNRRGIEGGSPLGAPGFAEELNRNSMTGLAAAQEMLGATPFTHPDMFPSADANYVDWINKEAVTNMENILGGPIKGGYLDLTYGEMVAVFARRGMLDTSMDSEQKALDSAIPGIETRIISNPIRDGELMLFARRNENEPFQTVTLGALDEMAAGAGEILGSMAGNSAAGRAFKGVRKTGVMDKALGKGTTNTAAARVASGGARLAGSILGGVGAIEAENQYLNQVNDIPMPSLQERINEARDVAIANGAGEVMARSFIRATKPFATWVYVSRGAHKDMWKQAERAISRYNGPRLLPAMVTQNGQAKITRMWNLTTRGARDTKGRIQQGMIMADNFLTEVGPGLGTMPKADAMMLVEDINKNMRKEALRKIPRLKEGWQSKVANTVDSYYGWMAHNQKVWADNFTEVGTKLAGEGATWNLSKVKANIAGVLGDIKYQTVDGPNGPIKISADSITKGGDVENLMLKVLQLDETVSGETAYGFMRQLRTTADNLDYTSLTTNTDKRLLREIQHGLYESLFNPKGASKETLSQLKEVNKGYKSFRDTDRLFQAASLASASKSATQIGRELVDPINNPLLVQSFHDLYKSGAMNKIEWEALAGSYAERISSLDPSAIRTLFQSGAKDIDSQKALDLVVPPALKKDLLKYALRVEDVVKNPKFVRILSEDTESGRLLVEQFTTDKSKFDAIVNQFRTMYGNKEGDRAATASIITYMMNSMKSEQGGVAVLDKAGLKNTALKMKAQGIFDDIATKEQLGNFDDVLAAIKFLPDGSDAGTAIARSERAGGTMPVPNPGSIFDMSDFMSMKSRGALLIDWLNARVILDAWQGGWTGYGKYGKASSGKVKYTLGLYMRILADKNFGRGPKASKMDVNYSGIETEKKLEDLADANLFLSRTPGMPEGSIDPRFNYSEIIRQAKESGSMEEPSVMETLSGEAQYYMENPDRMGDIPGNVYNSARQLLGGGEE